MKKVLVTGSAGFIGFHVSNLLLKNGYQVFGIDSLNNYYDVQIKESRNKILLEDKNYKFYKARIESNDCIKLINDINPDFIIHLAAQAGVRYSLENPSSYIQSNIVGTFNILEAAREVSCRHLMIASTSSVYCANTKMPFDENQKADTQLTIYSASKKSNESMAHSYSHLYKIPITLFRFFTVYGPWGRPDLALFKFVKNILNNEEIEVYNNGEMYRDFTYVDDLVHSIFLLLQKLPSQDDIFKGDSLSPVAPFRIVNIGNSNQVKLLDFIRAIEEVLGRTAKINFMPIQQDDVLATHSNTDLLKEIIGFKPDTDIKQGISKFIEWYKDYYRAKL